MIDLARTFVVTVNWIVFSYFFCINSFYLLLLVLSAAGVRGYLRRASYADRELMLRDPHTPEVTVLMPAHNEAVNIVMSVRGVLNLNYPSFQVIVINDGSTDDTLGVLRAAFSLVEAERAIATTLPTKNIRRVYRSLSIPNLTVIDKENGGKSDALNAGINASRTPYLCMVDADVILEENALLRLISPSCASPTAAGSRTPASSSPCSRAKPCPCSRSWSICAPSSGAARGSRRSTACRSATPRRG